VRPLKFEPRAPLVVRYPHRCAGSLGEKGRDKLLYWFIQPDMLGHFFSSTESFIDQDLAPHEGPSSALAKGLDQLCLWHGACVPNQVFPCAGDLGPDLIRWSTSGRARAKLETGT